MRVLTLCCAAAAKQRFRHPARLRAARRHGFAAGPVWSTIATLWSRETPDEIRKIRSAWGDCLRRGRWGHGQAAYDAAVRGVRGHRSRARPGRGAAAGAVHAEQDRRHRAELRQPPGRPRSANGPGALPQDSVVDHQPRRHHRHPARGYGGAGGGGAYRGDRQAVQGSVQGRCAELCVWATPAATT